MEDMDSEIKEESTPVQLARAKLRESFLRAVDELQGQKCNILTYEQSSLGGTFSGWKTDGSEILVENMKTPACIEMKSALLRTPDVLAIQFNESILNLNPL